MLCRGIVAWQLTLSYTEDAEEAGGEERRAFIEPSLKFNVNVTYAARFLWTRLKECPLL